MLGEMIKRSVFNWKMVVACGLGIALLYHEMIFGWVNLRGIIFESYYYSGLEDFFMLFAWSSYIIYAGIFPGLSYGFSFLEERKSGYLQMIRQRISVTKYVWYKVIAVGISGGVCTGITFLVSVGPIQFFTRNSSRVAFSNNDKQFIWQRIMEAYGKDSVYLFRFILMVLFGVLWAEAALLISLLVKNRYIAFALYFVVYELEFLLIPNPVESACMLRYDADYGDSLLVPYFYFACGIVAVSAVWKYEAGSGNLYSRGRSGKGFSCKEVCCSLAGSILLGNVSLHGAELRCGRFSDIAGDRDPVLCVCKFVFCNLWKRKETVVKEVW